MINEKFLCCNTFKWLSRRIICVFSNKSRICVVELEWLTRKYLYVYMNDFWTGIPENVLVSGAFKWKKDKFV